MKKKIIPKRSPVSNKSNLDAPPPPSNSFYVVGLGSSAGGLEALEEFFDNMAENPGMAFIIVSHLDPNHKSIMPELVQKHTKMKVFQAEDGMIVEPDRVYIAPPNRNLAILHGTLQLIEPFEAHGFRLPIDYFFKSLSADAGEKAIYIILSGMASDGSVGIRAGKSELGMVMVQDPASAKFDSMPSNAIKSGLVDYILPPEGMPEQLMIYTSQRGKGIVLEKANTESKIPDTFQKIFILLRNHTGHDFSLYKQNTLYRRVERRITVCQLDNLPNYIRFLQENPKEIESLFNELLIGVTNFFRDSEAFAKLKTILLQIVKNKPDGGQLRIWVPGCSTGEEAYSIAILVRECMNETKKNLNVQIYATDIDNRSIEKARLGLFTGIAADAGKERLNRFFNSDGTGFRIRKEIREMLIFAPHNVIKDPPFTKMDLISCRNLLIYFNSELHKKILPLFHYSLAPYGILFLGSSETVNIFVDLFSIVDNKWKIYKKRDPIYSTSPVIEFPTSQQTGRVDESRKKNQAMNIKSLSEKTILQNYSPDCMIIAQNGDIVYVHGRTGKYLELIPGEAKMNVFHMTGKGLQQELPLMIRKVLSEGKSVTHGGIKVKSAGKTYVINLMVKPIKEPTEMRDFLLIIFEEVQIPKKSLIPRTDNYKEKSGIIIKELDHELRSTKENLRSAVEELESSNEELKSSNEEMQSTNEEMQSSNEELQTSKEELQSVNEELITVNTELQNKNDELSIVSNDMKNLLESTDIPTIFLDINLCIKRFTFHATKVMNLIPSDIGRPIDHLATKLKYDKLIEDAKEVLRTLTSKQVELQTNESLWYQMRILPYRTANNVIEGVVVTFTDINKLKNTNEKIGKLNEEIQFAREYADNIVDTVRESLLILNKDLKVVSANRSFYKMFNTFAEKVVGKYIYELDGNKWDTPRLRKLLKNIISAQNILEDYEMDYLFADGVTVKLLLNARQMFYQKQETTLILLAIQFQSIGERGAGK